MLPFDGRTPEKALLDAQAAYQSLADHLPLSFLVKDLQGRRIFANRRYCEEHGVEVSADVGADEEFEFLGALRSFLGAQRLFNHGTKLR